jgi:hypothetical protein
MTCGKVTPSKRLSAQILLVEGQARGPGTRRTHKHGTKSDIRSGGTSD